MLRTDSTPAPSNQPELNFHDYDQVENFFGPELLGLIGLVHLHISESQHFSPDLLPKIWIAMEHFYDDPIKRDKGMSEFIQHLIHHLLKSKPENDNYRKELITYLIDCNPLYGLIIEGKQPLSKIHVSELPDADAGENFLEKLFNAGELNLVYACLKKAAKLCGGKKTAAFEQFTADTGVNDVILLKAVFEKAYKKFGGYTQEYKNLIFSTMSDAATNGDESLCQLCLREGERAYGTKRDDFISELRRRDIKFPSTQDSTFSLILRLLTTSGIPREWSKRQRNEEDKIPPGPPPLKKPSLSPSREHSASISKAPANRRKHVVVKKEQHNEAPHARLFPQPDSSLPSRHQKPDSSSLPSRHQQSRRQRSRSRR